MLVRDTGDAYQIVLQPDHGDFAGHLAAAFNADPALSTPTREALVIAATRHDDGWSVWERRPRLDAGGRPQSFLDVEIEPLLSSYRACADLAASEDPLAGLLVSMHVTGLRRGRYGAIDGGQEKPLDALDEPLRSFVREEERRQAELTRQLDLRESERWRAYALLQVFDVIALHVGLADLQSDERTITIRDGETFHLLPAGAPSTIACRPYPFEVEPARIPLTRRLLPRRRWLDDDAFRAEFHAAAPAQAEITFVAA